MTDGFWYMATPYTKYGWGRDVAFEIACGFAAELMVKNGYKVFSPIAHSHSIAEYGWLDPVDHEFWMDQCAPFMKAAEGLIVICMDGWRSSVGVAAEIEYFKSAGKKIFYYGIIKDTLSEEPPND